MKSLTAEKEVQVAELPSEVVIPLSQHIGWPSKVLVEVGDKVLKGQKIGEAGGFISAAIHASISGTVKSIEPFIHPSGGKSDAVIITSDGEDKLHESLVARTDEEIAAL